MSYLPTHSGDIWGSPAQKAAQLKAAKASADKRRKRHPDPQDMRDRGQHHPDPKVNAWVAREYKYGYGKNYAGKTPAQLKQAYDANNRPEDNIPDLTDLAEDEAMARPSKRSQKDVGDLTDLAFDEATSSGAKPGSSGHLVDGKDAAAKKLGYDKADPEDAQAHSFGEGFYGRQPSPSKFDGDAHRAGQQARKAYDKKLANTMLRGKVAQDVPKKGDGPGDTSGPTVAEVMADPHGYPSRAAHTDAIIAAKRRERLAAGHGPADIPKGKALNGDGKLVDATNSMTVQKKGPTLESERLQARIDDYNRQLKTPDSSIDGKRHMHLRNAVKETTRQLRVARGNEETRASNAALAKQNSTPAGKAAQEAFETSNGNRAALASLRKDVAKYPPTSFAGQKAKEQLERLEKRLGLKPGESPPALPRPGGGR